MKSVRFLTAVAFIAATMIFSATVQAQELEGEDAPRTTAVINTQHTLNSEGGYTPVLMLTIDHPVMEGLGVTCFGWADPGWGEVVCGVYATLGDWLRAGVMFGIEAAEIPVRSATQLIIAAGPFTLAGVVEAGGSGIGYDVRMLFRCTDYLQVGLMGQRGHGEGVLMRIDYGRVGFSFAYLYGLERYLTSDRSDDWHAGEYWTALLELSVRVSP